LKVLFAEDVMSTNVLTIATGATIADVKEIIQNQNHLRKQRLLPVVNCEGIILGVISWQDVLQKVLHGNLTEKVDDFMITNIITAFPDESLRSIADRMAANRVGVLPVIDRYQNGKLRGLITQYELLTARDHLLQEERKRERVLKMWPIYWKENRNNHPDLSTSNDHSNEPNSNPKS
jgi:CBS domain-containing protein